MATRCPKCHRPIPEDSPGGVCPYCVLEDALLGGTQEQGDVPPGLERDLVFCLFAVQTGCVSPAQFIEYGMQYIANPAGGLAAQICKKAPISDDNVRLIEDLTEAAVAHYGGDTHQTLSGLVSSGTLSRVLSMPPGDDEGDDRTNLGLPVAVDGDAGRAGALKEEPGRYSRKSEYSRGGMGRILLVHDQFLSRDIALKELLPEHWKQASAPSDETPLRRSSNVVARFLREAKVTGQLEHPNIVPVYELGQRPDGNLYYTMKLIRGESFSDALDKAGTLEARLAYLPNFIQVCQAVAYAHSRHVIHRDLKPGNIMLGPFGETVLIDWGLAKLVGQADATDEELRSELEKMTDQESVDDFQTRAGSRLGTPAYMSPEQSRGNVEAVGPPSDVYSLGVILYRILTGQLPVQAESASALLTRIANQPAPPAQTAAPGAPPELCAICDKALRFNPEERYSSAEGLLSDLEDYVSGALVSAYRYSLTDFVKRFYKRHKAAVRVGLAAAVLLLVMAGGAYARIYVERERAVAARDAAERSNYANSVKLASELIERDELAAALDTIDQAPEAYRGWEWHHLKRHASPVRFALPGYTNAAWLPSGTHCVLAGSHTDVALVDAQTGDTVRTFETAVERVNDLAVSPDGEWVAIAGTGKTIDVRHLGDGRVVTQIESRAATVFQVAFSPDGAMLASRGQDGTAEIWSTRTWTLRDTIRKRNTRVSSLQWSSTGDYLYGSFTSSDMRTEPSAIVWIARPGVDGPLRERSGTHIAVNTGKQYALVAEDDTVLRWNLADDASGMVWEADGATIVDMDYDEQNASLVLATSAQTVVHLDADTREPLFAYEEDFPIRSVQLHAGSGQVLALSQSRPIAHVRALATGLLLNQLDAHSGFLFSATFSPEGRYVATCMDDLTQIWTASTDRRKRTLLDVAEGARALAFSAANDIAFVATAADSYLRYALSEGEALPRLQGMHMGGTPPVALTSEGAYAVYLADSFAPCVAAADAQARPRPFLEHNGTVSALVAVPGSDDILSASRDGAVIRWHAADLDTVARDALDEGHALALAVHPDGDIVAAGTSTGGLSIREADTLAPVREFATGEQGIERVAFSADGAYLYCAQAGGALLILDAETGEEREVLRIGAIRQIAADMQGRRQFFGTMAGQVLAFAETDGEVLCSLRVSPARVVGVAYRPEAETLLSLSEPGLLQEHFGKQVPSGVADTVPLAAGSDTPLNYVGVTSQDDVTWFKAALRQNALGEARATQDSPFRYFGILPGDVILSIDSGAGSETATARLPEQVQDFLAAPMPDDFVIQIQRGSRVHRHEWQVLPVEQQDITVHVSRDELEQAMDRFGDILASRPLGQDTITGQELRQRGLAAGTATEAFGIALAAGAPGDERHFRAAGMTPHDRLLDVCGIPLRNAADFRRARARIDKVLDGKDARAVTATVQRGSFRRIRLGFDVMQ